jgi:hypothetical protein
MPMMASFVSDDPTSSAAGAGFLSCAPEDTDVARRIAEALRGFGVEVWSDWGELRNSDAWDEKIRGEIRACTKARREGCFWREWKLTFECTNAMASGLLFIVPVVIDNTAESRALVPGEVVRVQWTHLPHGEPAPQFVDQDKDLLSRPHQPVAGRPADPANFVSESDERLKKAESRFDCSVT